MMCIAACLLVFSLASLLVKRDSGSFEPTTGSCAASRPAPNTKTASPRVTSKRGFLIFSSPFRKIYSTNLTTRSNRQARCHAEVIIFRESTAHPLKASLHKLLQRFHFVETNRPYLFTWIKHR